MSPIHAGKFLLSVARKTPKKWGDECPTPNCGGRLEVYRQPFCLTSIIHARLKQKQQSPDHGHGRPPITLFSLYCPVCHSTFSH